MSIQQTCFVIMGFGIKTDYRNGREIDLDKTYNTIIKPAFVELGFICFRADEIKHSGVIDIPMYEHIIKSDFVLADISTLNANVLYELGVRHAVKKQATLIIAESELQFPFDLSHIVIDQYQHLGKAIDYDEVLRFREVIKDKVKALQLAPATDSPLYSLFPDLNTPSFTQKEIRELKEDIKQEQSISDLLAAAEQLKNDKQYEKAKSLYREAAKAYPSNEFITQRLVLMLYKSKWPTVMEGLGAAREELAKLQPERTTDPETLGLAGAISKRWYDETNDILELDQAIWFYSRGFYIKQDYYNGINLAFMLSLKATLTPAQIEAFGYYGQAIEIRKKVTSFCEMLVNDKNFKSRDDREWVWLTLAEAAFGRGDQAMESQYLASFESDPHSDFALSSYREQRGRLEDISNKFREQWGLADA
jgi:tetratricopeptide (TPR) repeat protein